MKGRLTMGTQLGETPLDVLTNSVLQGRYRLETVIGRGGMAAVYRARDELLGRHVAVKVFQASATDQGEIRSQEREVNLLAGLHHHSMVGLLDAGVDLTDPQHPHVYMVMELVGGANLESRLLEGPLSARQVAQIGCDLAEGLEYLHHHGVVHRDIKPANILMVQYTDSDTRLRAKLTDFGIALSGGIEHLAGDDIAWGTAAYLSPEQAIGDPIGPASDVYSLGLVLLECFTRKIAFPGAQVESALARLDRNPEIPTGLAPEWRELLTAMTAQKPEDRPLIRDVILSFNQALLSETARHRLAAAILPENEASRMSAVRRYEVLDTPPDGTFDRITALASRLFSAPIAIVSVVDNDRIWFKSHHGLDIEQVDRDAGLCASAVLHDQPWIIEDARLDPRALANPLVAGELGLQFYAGAPLRTRDGYNLGTLCVLDYEPRIITEEQVVILEDLAAMVMSELELRLESRRAVEAFRG